MIAVDKIMAYENGDLSDDEVVDMFAELVKSGDAFRLQGSYGRAAHALIQNGYISPAGVVLKYPNE